MPNNMVPFDEIPEDIKKQIVNKCLSQSCQDAKNELVRIRNDIAATCAQLDTAKSQRDTYGAIALAMLTAAGGVAIAAATTPWPINLELWIIVSVLGTLAIIFGALAANRQNLVNGLSTAISNKQSDFQAAVQTMNGECPEQCREDSTLPKC